LNNCGVPGEEIQRGTRKVNIDTDIRLAMTGAMRQLLAEQPGEFDPRKALLPPQAVSLLIDLSRHRGRYSYSGDSQSARAAFARSTTTVVAFTSDPVV